MSNLNTNQYPQELIEYISDVTSDSSSIAIDRKQGSELMRSLMKAVDAGQSAGLVSVTCRTLSGSEKLIIPSGVAASRLCITLHEILTSTSDGALHHINTVLINGLGQPEETQILLLNE
tara:strand:+ start:7936 stop:8292 length:357 start_codon:yes stop_codon:yes gene_type:complete